MISVGLDYTLFIQMFLFLVIVLVVNKMIVSPIKNTMDKRDAKVELLQSQAKSYLLEIENKKQLYDEKNRAVGVEISDYYNRLKSDTDARVQSMLDKVKAEIAENASVADAELSGAVAEARIALEQDVSALTKQIVNAVSK